MSSGSRSFACSFIGFPLLVSLASCSSASKIDSPQVNAGRGGVDGAGASTGGSGFDDSAGHTPTGGMPNVAGASAGGPGGGANAVGGAGGGASGTGGADDDTSGIGVRFVGFVAETEGADLPVSTDFLSRFPDCPAEPSTIYAPSSRFNECFARGIVGLMNSSLAELLPNPPHFHFESFELVADDRLVTFHSDPSYSGYELQHLFGNTYRRGNTMTFVMPSTKSGPVAGLADEDQRLNPDFGMLAIAVPVTGVGTLLHEFGHGLGFPHSGNAAGVGSADYAGCGGVTLDPPACLCEPNNFMTTLGSFADTSGCEPCPFTGATTTYDTEFFGPKYATIAACWDSRRLEPSQIGFVDGDCFALVDSSIATCFESEGGGVACKCPSGQAFTVEDCTDASQPARNAAASAVCDRISCPPPPERPDVVCKGLAGAPTIACVCDDQKTHFSLGMDCSTLTLANIEKLCPTP